MINLDKALTLALLSKVCTIVKTYVDNKISALATSLQDILEDVDTEIDNKVIAFRNVSVALSTWASDATYSDYPYRASITCAGVTADYIPDVIFGETDSESGNFAAMSETANNTVYIYAKQKPAASITLLTIECRKAVTK
jgi:hypothetical protein